MTAPTAAVEYLLARAAVRVDGIMHIVSQRDTGALNPVCGANPVRSKAIDTWSTVPAADDLELLCADCAGLALRTPGVTSLEQGIAVWLGIDAGVAGTRLLPIALDAMAADDAPVRDADALPALAASIAASGLLQPLTVRRSAAGYQVVIGRRRLAAARLAGLHAVPALVRDVDDEQAVLDTLTENLHRADLNPIEQARGFARALELLEISQTVLAQRLEISRPQIANTLRLLTLPTPIQDLVASGAVNAAQARELLRLDDEAAQLALASQIVEEGLTVRQVAERREAASSPAPAPQRADFSQLLADLRAARVLVTLKGNRARITIDVAEGDVDHVLEQLGRDSAAAVLPAAA